MKKLATIFNEVPNTEVALNWYVKLCEKEIKSCELKKEELTVAISEAKRRLKLIENQGKNASTIS